MRFCWCSAAELWLEGDSLLKNRGISGPGGGKNQTAMEHGTCFEVKSLALKGLCKHRGCAHGWRGWGAPWCIFVAVLLGLSFAFCSKERKLLRGKMCKVHKEIWSGTGRGGEGGRG